jgi:hypothetical protein
VHFRDLLDGKLFHVFVRDATDAVRVFLMADCAWVGMPICVFEPEFEFVVGGIPALTTEHPLLPLRDQGLGNVMTPYQREWAISPESKAVFIRGADLTLRHINIQAAGCGAAMCDGQHSGREKCCALTSGTPNKVLLNCTVSSQAAGIEKEKFTSAAWTRVLMHEECMKVSSHMCNRLYLETRL